MEQRDFATKPCVRVRDGVVHHGYQGNDEQPKLEDDEGHIFPT